MLTYKCALSTVRTGKSFFLNQLTRGQDARPTVGFRVGPTTESCTRGIWLWSPEPCVRNTQGQRVLFMDTEGLAATDNDESYDAKIFSLGLLLSSLFVFNTMGVIDEGAIDRLYLVSELTKHVCVSADTGHGRPNGTVGGKANAFSMSNGDDDNDDDLANGHDTLAESRALAPHFPPFVWLLRDFLLDMQADGAALSANEYLEKSLEPREGGGRRQEDRNRIRASIRILFARRECQTLVRPVTDELALRRAAELSDAELRPEFVQQMGAIRSHILGNVHAKQLFGKVLNGPQIAKLVQCYTATMTSGAVPDIKAAWEYVADATCQTALLSASDAYDQMMMDAMGPETGEDGEDDSDAVILSQQEFEKAHKNAQEEALTLFRDRSVESASRAVCFQKLKQHVHRVRTSRIATLQRRSTAQCARVLHDLKTALLTKRLADCEWDDLLLSVDNHDTRWLAETMDTLESQYDQRAQGPAHKAALFQFLRDDMVQFVETVVKRLAQLHNKAETEWHTKQESLMRQREALEAELRQLQQQKDAAIQQLSDAKTHLEDKIEMQQSRIAELLQQGEEQRASIAALEDERRTLTARVEASERSVAETSSELDKMTLRLEYVQEAARQRDEELQRSVHQLNEELATLRKTHEADREDWIKRVADQTAEKTALQKQLKHEKHTTQQLQLDLELRSTERDQLALHLASERSTREKVEDELALLTDLVSQHERQREELEAEHAAVTKDALEENARLRSRVERFQAQLGRQEGDHEVADVLRDCIDEVIRVADAEKLLMLQEERGLLQEKLGDLYMKISTLPDFYQREIFCAPEPVPNFFDALTGQLTG